MPVAALDALDDDLGPLRLRYCPLAPLPKQELWLMMDDVLEAFFGGAAGPGKSAALLMAALQYVDVPGYSALLMRRTYRSLALPGALIEMSHEWLGGTDAHWSGIDSQWRFPSGATLTFGYLQTEDDKRRYASAQFQFIGFDELTHFLASQYLFMFSRLRGPSPHAADRLKRSPDGITLADVPLRMRSASNPGGRGHEWVKDRFITGQTRPSGVVFIPALTRENPFLDVSYRRSLARLPAVERQRLETGNWDVTEGGGLIDPYRIRWVESEADLPSQVKRRVRYWDMAATEPDGTNDPDYTVGCLYARLADDSYAILDIVRFRKGPGETKRRVLATALADGRPVHIRMEQEPGSSGKVVVHDYAKSLRGFVFKGIPSSGDKETRAWPFAGAIDNDLVYGVSGAWTAAYMRELELFPADGIHDDQVDASSGAHSYVTSSLGKLSVSRPKGRHVTIRDQRRR